jgi:hypothetical protein
MSLKSEIEELPTVKLVVWAKELRRQASERESCRLAHPGKLSPGNTAADTLKLVEAEVSSRGAASLLRL